MTALLLCPRCTQSLPGEALFCRRCGMAMPGAVVRTVPRNPPPASPPPQNPPAQNPPPQNPPLRPPRSDARPSRSGVGAGLLGLVFFAGLAFLLMSVRHVVRSTPHQPSLPTVAVPAPAAGGWSTAVSPGVQVMPAQSYPASPPTIYRVAPEVPYHPVPETNYPRPHEREPVPAEEHRRP